MRTTSRTAGYRVGAAPVGGVATRLLGMVLCLGVAAIHVIDQHGFPGDREPGYVGLLFYALEAAGVLAAVLLLAGRRSGWLLALGVAAGPLVGYVLSRGPGLPAYTDDVGNWAEPLGVVSLAVEAALLVLALAMLRRTLLARAQSGVRRKDRGTERSRPTR